MAITFDSIATTTLSTAASSITISSIPGTYQDLKAYLVFRSSGNASTNNIPVMYLNSTTNQWYRYQITSGSTTPNGGVDVAKSGIWIGSGSYTANSTHWFCAEINIMDYANSTREKLVDARFSGAQTGGANQESTVLTGSQANLKAVITSMTISDAIFGNTYAAGTTLSLFGIARA